MPRAGDNIFLFESGSGSTSLPAGRKPRRHAVKETSRTARPPFACPALRLPPLPPRQQIRHARPAQRTAARGAALCTGDASSAARRVLLRQRANGDPACGGTSDGGRAALRVALRAGTRWTTRAARTGRDGPRASSSSIWEYPKFTTTSRPLELERLMVEEHAHRRGSSAQGMR